MIDSTFFVTTAIIAATQIVKIVAPKISGVLTILIAVLLGVLIAVFHTALGVTALSPAQGIIIGLSAVGIHTVATRRTSTATDTATK